MPKPAPIDREPRHSVLLSATVERFGKLQTTLHRIRNLSSGGVCIGTAAAFQRGETILVSVGSLKAVGGTVRWVEKDLAGILFAQAIDVDAARAKTMIRAKPQAMATRFRPLG